MDDPANADASGGGGDSGVDGTADAGDVDGGGGDAVTADVLVDAAPTCEADCSLLDDRCMRGVCGSDGCELIANDEVCYDGIACTVGVCDLESPQADIYGCVQTNDDTLCDDSASCTTDICNPTSDAASPSGCIHRRDDTACPSRPAAGCLGYVCEPSAASDDTGCAKAYEPLACGDFNVCQADGTCAPGGTCMIDADCDDGDPCNGTERCINSGGRYSCMTWGAACLTTGGPCAQAICGAGGACALRTIPMCG